jgi:hypothetical protein
MKRKILKNLISWKNAKDRKPLILYGARQVGKTYVLKQFGTAEFGKLFYLNFDERREELSRLFSGDLSAKEIVMRIEILYQQKIDFDNDLLIFDEIQECPRALTSLKYFSESMKQLAVCSAGSHLGLFLNDESFPVGQVDMLNLYPMDFEEFLREQNPALAEALQAIRHPSEISEFLHAKLWETLKIFYVLGGLPAAVACFLDRRESMVEAFTAVRSVQKNLITGYMSDFSKHAGKENASHIRRIFENIPVQLSRETDGSARRFRFKGVVPNKTKYEALAGPIDWLVKAGLAIKVPITELATIPLKAYTKENFFKLYLFDIGVLGAMLDLPVEALLDQDYGMYKGFFAENYVAQALLSAGMTELFSWVHRTAELEFLCIIDGRIVPIEVKSGKQEKSKSLSEFAKRYSPPKMIRISALPFRQGTTVTNYPLYLAASAIG